MKLIKNENLKYLLVGILIVLIFFLTSVKSKGQEQYQEPITYDFVNDSILDVNQDFKPNYYNLRNSTEYTMDYESQFTYKDDWNDFITFDNSGVNSGYRFSNNYLGHNDNLEFYTSGTSDFNCSYSFTNKSDNLIEFWLLSDNSSVKSRVSILNDGIHALTTNTLLFLQFNVDEIQVRHGDGAGGSEISHLTSCISNNWYHIAINISLLDDTFDFYVNEFQELDDKTFYDDQTFDSFNTIQFSSNDGSEYVYSIYLDGFDTSFYPNFITHRNLFPILKNNKYLEVDKYEMDYTQSEFNNGFCSWYDVERNDDTNFINIYGTNYIDNYLDFYMLYGSVYSQEVYLNNGNSNAMIMNFTLEIEITSYSDNTFNTYIYIVPKNGTDADDWIKLRLLDENGNFYVWNTKDYTYDEVFSPYETGKTIYVNIYVNYYSNQLIYNIDYDGTHYHNNYYFDQSDKGMYGFKNFFIRGICSETTNPSGLEQKFKNIGIYENGKSYISKNDIYDFGLMSYKIDDSWNSDEHNLLTIESDNYYNLYVHNYYTYFRDGYSITEFYNQTKPKIFNLQDNINNNYPKFIYSSSYLIFQVYGNCTNPYEIEIEGVKFIDSNGNIVYGNYYYNNTDSNYNWFYAIDNKLYYNFNNNDSSGLETMRISFDINDILIENGSLISYSSYITNNYSGYINIDSYYERETFDIFNNDSLVHSFLNLTDSNHFTVKEIVIEVQSTYYSYNLSKGYIQNINLYPEKPLFPDFKPIEYLESTFLEKMIETIIPMLFFIIPSIILRTRYGNKSVIPMWILLTFIFLIVNFIPFWICFIIFLAIGLMVINKDKEVIE